MANANTHNRHLLSDIELTLSHRELRPVYRIRSRRRRAPDGDNSVIDVPVIAGNDNLVQAVILRLLTPRGELSPLGHPLYGSRLHEMIGRTNTETTRNLVRVRVLECLKDEVRIAKIVSLDVTPSVGRRSSIDMFLQVLPQEAVETISIGPLTLELGT